MDGGERWQPRPKQSADAAEGEGASAPTSSSAPGSRNGSVHGAMHFALEAPECFPGLPDDLAVDIVARLPRGCAFSLRRVSRAWRKLVLGRELRATRQLSGSLEEWLFVLPEHPRGNQFLALDPRRGRWVPVPRIPGPRLEGFACVGAGGKLLVIGGLESRQGLSLQSHVPSARVWQFDPSAWKWTAAPDMGAARAWCAAGVLDDRYVYVSGGQGRDAFLSSVEMYDTKAQQWRKVCSMHLARCSHRMVPLGSALIAIAGEWERHDRSDDHGPRGHAGTAPKASVEVFDPSMNTWTLLRDSWISTEKVPCPVAVVKDVLYAVSHGSVHAWDPETGNWRFCGDTPGRDAQGRPFHMSGQGCAALDGRIIIFGGTRDVWINRTRLTQQSLGTVHSWEPPSGQPAPARGPHLWDSLAGAPVAQAGAAVSSFQSPGKGIMLWKEHPPMEGGCNGHILASAVVMV